MYALLAITNFVGGLSLLLNLLLSGLIWLYTPAHLGAFKANYYGMTIVDTLFALSQFLAAPCFFSDGNAYLIFSRRPGGSYLIIFFMIMHNISFKAISFNCCCRYLMVCNNTITKLLNKKWARRLFYLHNANVIVLSLIAVFIVFHIPTNFKTGMNNKYAARLEINFETDLILGSAKGTLYWIGNYSEMLRYGSFSAFIIYGFFNISATYLWGAGMFAYIKSHSFSIKLRLINYRILVILTTQATMSAVFVYTPGLLTAIFELIEFDGSNLAEVISSLMSFATLFTPAIVILLTREYRITLVKLLRKYSNGPASTRISHSYSLG